MAPEPQSRGPVLAVAALLAVSTLGALAVLLRGGGGSAPKAGPNAALARASRAWPDDSAPAVQDTSVLSRGEPTRSGLDMLERPPEAARAGSLPDASSAGGGDGTVSAGTGRVGAVSPPGGTDGPSGPDLTDAEKAALAKAAGQDLMDPAKAAAVAADDGPWTSLLGALGKSPRLLHFLLNNDMVVKGFMSRPTSKKFCQSASAYRGYLTDTKSPGGVNHAMNVFEKLLHAHPENPTLMFGSKLGESITNCPSVQSIVKDGDAVRDIATSNPRALSMMMDPNVMKGLSANPAAMTAFGGVQASLTGGGKP